MTRRITPVAAVFLALAPFAHPFQGETQPTEAARPLTTREQKDLEKLASRPQPTEFELAVEVVRTRLVAAREAAALDLAKGDLRAVVQALQAAAPKHATDPAEALALGNALFDLDAGAALAAHGKARELAPDDRSVLAAWGRELHREGRVVEAAEAYRSALDRNPPDALLLHGLRTAALLRAGAIEEALDAWEKCTPFQVRIELEAALRAIHRHGDKEHQRRELFARAKADEPEAIERMLLLDLAWKGEGEYPLSNRPYVAQDLELAAQKYGKESRRFVELEFLANGRMGMEPRPKDAPAPSLPEPSGRGEGTGFGAALPPSVVERAGRKLGFVGYGKDNKRFPASSVIAPAIYRMLFLDGDIVSSEWIGWFDGEMRKRATSEAGDIDAALLLLDLYEQTLARKFDGWEKLPDKFAEWQTATWSRYPDPRVAQRILAWKGKDLALDDPVLKAALEHFPEDEQITTRAIEASRRASGKVAEPLLIASARAALFEEDVLDANRHLVELKLTRAKQNEPSAPAKVDAPK